MNAEKKLKRTADLVRVLIKYGFNDLVERIVPDKLHLKKVSLETDKAEFNSMSVYKRIKLVLEELGPTYVKFGQLFSNRDDLLPPEMIAELQQLQDQVKTDQWDVKALLKKELKKDPDAFFSELSEEPMAAASMSQVYKAKLKESGQEVVLKMIRPGIADMIESDLLIMHDLVALLEKYNEQMRSYHIGQVLKVFDGSIRNELSLLHELSSMQRFARNFKDNQAIYVPETYPDLCSDHVLCMEFIRGIKVTDKAKLLASGLDPVAVAMNGLDLYLQQVMEHGFFHADPHPGNIFVLPEGQLVFIDFGNMGTILPDEMELLEDFMANFAVKDTRRIVKVLKRIAISYDIQNEKELERKIFDICEMIDTSDLQHLSWRTIFNKLKVVFHENNVELPDFAYSLMRGLALIEGIGEALSPDINVSGAILNYTQKIIEKRTGARYIISKTADKLRTINETVADLPENIQDLIEKLKKNELKMVHEVRGLDETRETIGKGIDRLVLAMIITALSIGSAILVVADVPPKIYNVPVLGFFGFVISGILGVVIVVNMMRKK